MKIFNALYAQYRAGINLRQVDKHGYAVQIPTGEILAVASERSIREMLAKGHAVQVPKMKWGKTSDRDPNDVNLSDGVEIYRCSFEYSAGTTYIVPEKSPQEEGVLLFMSFDSGPGHRTVKENAGTTHLGSIVSADQKTYSLVALYRQTTVLIRWRQIVPIASSGTIRVDDHPKMQYIDVDMELFELMKEESQQQV